MKPLHRTRLTLLAGAAGLALLAATWLGADDDAALPSAPKRPRATHGAAAATTSSPVQPAQSAQSAQSAKPAQAAGAVGLRAADLLGGAALAAPAACPGCVPSPAGPRPAARDAKAPPADRHAALAALDTTLVAQRAAGDAAATDAFATKSWSVAPPPSPPAPEAPPAPPPPPQAPPLPFKYMGSMQEAGGRTVWYLLQGERLIVAGAGDVIDSAYRAEGIEGGQLRFTYLPLNQRQTLSIGVAP